MFLFLRKFKKRRVKTIFKELLINDKITAEEVRVISENGEQLGVMSLNDALDKANSVGLDLVCMNPSATPAVCKFMNYGKYKFDMLKKEKEAKKNQKVTELKEIQLSMTIDTHDLEVKAKHGNRFLTEGNKVKVVWRMRGRQQAYANMAVDVCKKFAEMLAENGSIDKEPEIVGRNIIMIVNPKK